MSEQPSGKPCVICGEDCAGQPRTKDVKGNYYHQRCHDAAKRAKDAHDAAAAAAAAASAPANPGPGDMADFEEPEPFGLLDELIDAGAPAAAAMSPALAAGQMCPGCAVAIAPGAVICTNCGFNLQTGGQAQPTAMAAPVKAGGGEGRVWPVVIGVISILFGAGGVLLYGYGIVNAGSEISNVGGAVGGGGILANTILLLLSAWLLLSGIGLARHKQEAAVQIRRWAITKIILYATCFGCLSILVVASGSALSQIQAAMEREMGDEMSGGFATLGVGILLAWMAISFAWFLTWPIFVLIWFGRGKVQAQIGQW